jgi:hypothetical protein
VSAARNPNEYLAPPAIARIQVRSLVIGVVFLAVAVIAAVAQHNAAQFFRSYLLGYVWWTSVTLGCLAVLMLQHLTGGLWGFVIRRPLEAAVRVFPLLAVLFVPLIFAIPTLYLWGNPEIVAHDPTLQHQAQYLAPKWFIFRECVYFVAWIIMAHFLNRWSAAQDESGDRVLRRRLVRLSGPGLAICVLTVAFSSIDWVMSLDPHWASTIFPFILISGQVLSAFSVSAAMLYLLAKSRPMSEILEEKHVHSIGKLMLAFVMLWAYMSFSQLLIIWSGNLPDEISWYLRRLNSGWKYVGLALVVFHFAVPFILLLSRDLKRNPRKLAWVAMLLVAMRYLDLLWWIAPNPLPGMPQGIGFQWMDIVVPAGVGGLWMAAFTWFLRRRPLVPLYDQRFEEVVEHAGK